MQQEKAGELFHWIDKLDQLSELPGEVSVDKSAAWEKLHNRLQKKPRRKRAVAYWAAAACMLLATGIWWLTLEQSGGPIKNKAQQVQQDVVEKRIQVTDSKEPITASAQVITEKKPALPVEPKHETHYPVMTNTVLYTPVAPDADTTQKFLPQTIVNTTQPVDTLITAAVPAKKKLRVVHINELGHVEQETQLARITPAPVIPAKPGPDDLSNFSVSRNASDNILKIKISSN